MNFISPTIFLDDNGNYNYFGDDWTTDGKHESFIITLTQPLTKEDSEIPF
jgi:hypothetical protein